MSYCPECCSEEIDNLKRGNKRFFICEVCGAEWVEEEAGSKVCEYEEPPLQQDPQIAELYRRRRY